MSFKEALRNKFLEIAAEAVDKGIKGSELTGKLDEQLDKTIGEKTSEKIQRGPMTNLLLEMTEGLWAENPSDLIPVIEEWMGNLKKASDLSKLRKNTVAN